MAEYLGRGEVLGEAFDHQVRGHVLDRAGVLIVSPLATLAFKLCVVGDTGLKTEWVSCELR